MNDGVDDGVDDGDDDDDNNDNDYDDVGDVMLNIDACEGHVPTSRCGLSADQGARSPGAQQAFSKKEAWVINSAYLGLHLQCRTCSDGRRSYTSAISRSRVYSGV